ncbi:MAG: bifunctional homocysteine S-methyltransferase/methylenetetrahydrofolate reductase [Veillonellales bacterium]
MDELIREYLKNNLLIADGAMGTYYDQITGIYDSLPEFANLREPEIIEQIHAEYIDAGAKLIRTNTFSANCFSMNITRTTLRQVLTAGVQIADKAAEGKDVFVAASIGPIPEMVDKTALDRERVLAEYQFIADVLLAAGAKVFIFETFSGTEYLKEITQYIKEKNNSAFVLAQFATTPEGFTRNGIRNERIVAEMKKLDSLDAYGFNCGVGPTHLHNLLQKIDITGDIVSVMPNAGYPEIVKERILYIQNPDYFANKMNDIRQLGVKIIGGCCGTTPAHIKKMVEVIRRNPAEYLPSRTVEVKPAALREKSRNEFSDKLTREQFVVAVELDPPFNANSEKILHNARICKDNGVDIITIADSPMGRARVDSVAIAAKIKREVGIDVLPHLCCRDKNLNALKSGLLAAYMEGIRNILAVTGDPILNSDKKDIKSVFNLNSLKLIEMIRTMNQDVFSADPFQVGGALNVNAAKPEVELERMSRKRENGAAFFLTQPVFNESAIEFIAKARSKGNVKLLGGIMPLVSYRNAQFLNNEMPGIQVPEVLINQFDASMAKQEAEDLGIALAVKIAEEIKPHVNGFYFITPFNRVEMIMKIWQRLK